MIRSLTDDGKNDILTEEIENDEEIKDGDLIRKKDTTKNIPEVLNEQIIIDNLKTVFIENRSSTNELNFYKNSEEIRRSYLVKLISTKTPNQKPKTHNSIIINDCDDTLISTTFLTQGVAYIDNVVLSDSVKEKISQLEQLESIINF